MTLKATLATKFAAMHYAQFSGYSRVRTRRSAFWQDLGVTNAKSVMS
jgi:hypothetical protein